MAFSHNWKPAIKMLDIRAYMLTLAVILLAAVAVWLISLIKRNVSIVDSLWSLLFLLGVVVYFSLIESSPGPRTLLILVLVALWAIRLSVYITVRNWGHGEDHRYQAIRARNQPNFAFKSLYLVFGLQGMLAWFIALPLLVAAGNNPALGWLDYAGIGLWLVGMSFETLGDFQLSRFKANPANAGKVMDSGFWRYTRHPNYFGEFTLWWGYYLIAVAAGGWWTLPAPLLMSLLLLKVSGVSLLEKDIGERRPGYAEYIQRTNAFFPGPVRIVSPAAGAES